MVRNENGGSKAAVFLLVIPASFNSGAGQAGIHFDLKSQTLDSGFRHLLSGINSSNGLGSIATAC